MEKIKQQIEDEIKSKGYSITYRKQLTGRVSYRNRTCAMPEIKTRKSLYIALHELGHIVNGHIRPVYKGEYLAEKYAHARMRELGLTIPRIVTARAKEYVQMKIRRAERRHINYVDPQIRKWAEGGKG